MSVAAFYRAFAEADAAALLGCLAPDFVGTVSAGMPAGAGGVHRGADAMLSECWVPVFLEYDVAPRPDEVVDLPDGRVLVLGRYLGTQRATGAVVDAAFAHVLTLDDDLVVALTQITDTASWPLPRTGPAHPGSSEEMSGSRSPRGDATP